MDQRKNNVAKWLESYSGQSTEQLLSLQGEYRTDSLVAAFEQGIERKSSAGGEESLTAEEEIVLAVEALEREVNNGGYSQFFLNSSAEYSPMIVNALKRIGCPKTAEITQKAVNALHLPQLDVVAIQASIAAESDALDEALAECDGLYYDSGEDIAGRLFAFIQANKRAIKL
jgi:hypothetical protein